MGELNENIWSLGSSKVMPSASNLVLKVKSCVPPSSHMKRSRQVPSPSYMAVSAESVSRLMVAWSVSAVMRSMSRHTLAFLPSPSA